MMSRPKIVLIGAGSLSFGIETVSGLLAERKALRGATVSLVDIDEASLENMAGVVRRANDDLDAGFTIEATSDRRSALRDADFVVVSVEVNRAAAWQMDWDIPIRFGIKHVYGENGGPGGLSHSLRTIPLVLGICRDVQAIAPHAFVMNYTNPMTRVCMALTRYTDLRIVGLCHGIGHAFYKVGKIMGWISAPLDSREEEDEYRSIVERIEIQAAGINHLTFITELRDRTTGEDLSPAFADRLAVSDPTFEPTSRQLYDAFGLYPAQFENHVGEYIGWASDETGPELHELADDKLIQGERLAAVARGELPLETFINLKRRREHEFEMDRAPAIIAAIVDGRQQYELAVNVPNEGCMDGLPDRAVVEVPAVAGSFGIRPLAMGHLPPGVTAILNQQIAIQDRVVEAAVHGDRTAALQALLLDPVSSQDFAKTESMLDALLTAHAAQLPQFEAGAPQI
jgi:alpha-galactosidase